MENDSSPLEDASHSVERVEKISSSLVKIWKAWSWLPRWWKGEETDEVGTKPHESKGRIIILGAGGTGKSTLGHLLAGSLEPWLSDLQGYQESIVVEEFQLLGREGVGIIVPPGQEDRRPFSWSDFQDQLRTGKIRGVILVSAYGYHSFRGRMVDHRIYPNTTARGLAFWCSLTPTISL